MTSGSEDDETCFQRQKAFGVLGKKADIPATYLLAVAKAAADGCGTTAAVIYSTILMMNLEVQNDTHMGDSVNKLK